VKSAINEVPASAATVSRSSGSRRIGVRCASASEEALDLTDEAAKVQGLVVQHRQAGVIEGQDPILHRLDPLRSSIRCPRASEWDPLMRSRASAPSSRWRRFPPATTPPAEGRLRVPLLVESRELDRNPLHPNAIRGACFTGSPVPARYSRASGA
jgi:hypothetical protein